MEKQFSTPEKNEVLRDGLYYLKLLEIEHLASTPIPNTPYVMQDFLEICGDHALPVLKGLDRLDRKSPKFIAVQALLQDYILKFLPTNS